MGEAKATIQHVSNELKGLLVGPFGPRPQGNVPLFAKDATVADNFYKLTTGK